MHDENNGSLTAKFRKFATTALLVWSLRDRFAIWATAELVRGTGTAFIVGPVRSRVAIRTTYENMISNIRKKSIQIFNMKKLCMCIQLCSENLQPQSPPGPRAAVELSGQQP